MTKKNKERKEERREGRKIALFRWSSDKESKSTNNTTDGKEETVKNPWDWLSSERRKDDEEEKVEDEKRGRRKERKEDKTGNPYW